MRSIWKLNYLWKGDNEKCKVYENIKLFIKYYFEKGSNNSTLISYNKEYYLDIENSWNKKIEIKECSLLKFL